jgi:hypothetical protein
MADETVTTRVPIRVSGGALVSRIDHAAGSKQRTGIRCREIYKQTTLQQWNQAAEAWHRWNGSLSRWLGPAPDAMLDMAAVS